MPVTPHANRLKWFWVIRHSVSVAGLAAGCAVACDNAPAPPQQDQLQSLPRTTTSRLEALASAMAPPKTQLSPETQRKLVKLRNETLRFTPREEPLRRLAFFGTHLARLTRDALYIGSLTEKAPNNTVTVKRTPIQGGRELARLADDSLLVVTNSSTVRLDSGGRPQSPLGKVTFFPGMRLWPELRYPRAFATFDSNNAELSLYRWDDPSAVEKTTGTSKSQGAILLPKTVTTLEGLDGSVCTLHLDGSYACIKGLALYTGWPGFPTKHLGAIEAGATVVRLLPGARLDRIRVLRSDARLEEYWAVASPKLLSTLTLPWVPFDVVRLKDAFAVLKLTQGSPELNFSLTVVETSGKSRWTKPLEVVPSPSDPTEFDREVLDCPSLAAHPQKPWLAFSNCLSVVIFDSQTGTLLAEMKDVRF